jgi:hypothetical protein
MAVKKPSTAASAAKRREIQSYEVDRRKRPPESTGGFLHGK